MKFAFRLLTRLLGILTVISFVGIIVIVTLQISSRFLPFSYVWTEELTRYCFLFAISFGAPLALLKNEYINVDLIVGRLTNEVRRVYEIVIYMIILIFSLIMSKEAYYFMLLGHKQKSATMEFKMSLIHSSIFIMSIFLVFYCLVRLWYAFKDKPDKLEMCGGEEQ